MVGGTSNYPKQIIIDPLAPSLIMEGNKKGGCYAFLCSLDVQGEGKKMDCEITLC